MLLLHRKQLIVELNPKYLKLLKSLLIFLDFTSNPIPMMYTNPLTMPCNLQLHQKHASSKTILKIIYMFILPLFPVKSEESGNMQIGSFTFSQSLLAAFLTVLLFQITGYKRIPQPQFIEIIFLSQFYCPTQT